MPSDEGEALVVYSDYICPFCYLGKASLETYQAEAQAPPPVEWRPFDLRRHKRDGENRIDHSVQDGKDEAYVQRVRENVRRLMDAYDVEMTLDIPEEVDAWNAHKLGIAVQDQAGPDTFQAFHEAVFEALWVQGRDIGDPDVLVEICQGTGVYEASVREALSSQALEERVEEVFKEVHRAGVTGVPTFAYGDLAVPGAIPPEHLAKLVENG